MPETADKKEKTEKVTENKRQLDYWNSIAGEKEFTSELDIDKLFGEIEDNASVLDYGCGYGRLYPIVTKKRSKLGYIGYDPASKMIKEAKKRNPNIEFHSKLSTLKKSIPAGGFDAVLLVSVLTAVPDNKDQRDLINQICSLVKPNGVLLVNDFVVNRDQRNIDRYSEARKKYNHPYGVFELENGLLLRHHTEIHLMTLLEDCFDIVSYENGVFKTMNGNFSNAAKIVARKKN